MEKSRLAIVIPPSVSPVRRDVGIKESLPHIGVAYIAGNTDKTLTDVKVFDCPAMGMSLKKLTAELDAFSPRVIGFTALTSQIVDTHNTALSVKKFLGDPVILLGGYHVSAVPEETLRKFPAFDLVLRGEGEIAINEIMAADGLSPETLSGIKGLCFRRDGEVVLNEERPFNENLDALSYPAFELMPMDRYVGLYNMFSRRRLMAPISTGRGCPCKCIFCFNATGSKYRTRSIESVLDEVARDIRDFNIMEIGMSDESFLQRRERIEQFCEGMISRGYNKKLTWLCQARVDHANPDVLKLMKRSGCRVVSYGIESGDENIIKGIKKGITFEQAINAIKWTKEAGILTDTNYIIGHPGETRETIRKTIAMSVKIDADMASFAIMVPFPGTIVAEMAKRGEGGLKLLTDDYSKFGKQVGAAMCLEDISRPELEAFHRQAYMRFYLRPSRILKLFMVTDFSSLFRMGIHTLKSIFRPGARDI